MHSYQIGKPEFIWLIYLLYLTEKGFDFLPINRASYTAGSQPPPSQPQKKETKPIQWEMSQPKYRLSDLILPDETQNSLLDVLAFYENRTLLFQEWGLADKYSDKDSLTVNLFGPSGTGKTMAAHAVAAELGLPMLNVNYAEIESKYVGETSKNLASLFVAAKEKQALIFFDEADALLSKRVTNMTSATDVSVNQTRSVLLTLLNDYRGAIIFATNFIQNYDAAFLRRIRFHVQFYLPDKGLRELLWRTYIPARMPCTADAALLAEKFDGVSGSDISNAVFVAAVAAARQKSPVVTQSHLEAAIQRGISAKEENREPKLLISTREVPEEEMKEIIRDKESKQ